MRSTEPSPETLLPPISHDPEALAGMVLALTAPPQGLVLGYRIQAVLMKLPYPHVMGLFESLVSRMERGQEVRLELWRHLSSALISHQNLVSAFEANPERAADFLEVIARAIKLLPVIGEALPNKLWKTLEEVGQVIEASSPTRPGVDRALASYLKLMGTAQGVEPQLIRRAARIALDRSPKALRPMVDEWAASPSLFGMLLNELVAAIGPDDQRLAEWVELLLWGTETRPPAAWQRRWEALRPTMPEAELRRLLLSLANLHGPGRAEHLYQETYPYWWGPDTRARAVARAAIWALASIPNAEVRDFFEAVLQAAEKSGEGNPPLGNTAIWALAQGGDDDALQRLFRMQSRLRHRTLLKTLGTTIEEVATRQGLSNQLLADRVVSIYELDGAGRREWTLGDHTVTIALTTAGAIEQTITESSGKAKRSLPMAVREAHGETWKALQTTTRELRKALTREAHRIEGAMVEGHRWPLATWEATYRTHPLLRTLAHRLVWTAHDPAGNMIGHFLPSTEGGWHDQHGEATTLPEGSTLTLAHPCTMSPADQSAWQRRLVALRMVQPFKQLFRESYFLTPAEREAGTLSARFAGHIVPMGPLYALAKERGWGGSLGVGFDSCGEGWRDFPTHGVRAFFEHEWSSVEGATTQCVSFFHLVRKGKGWQSGELMRLEAVPPLVFSEAMRDVDLFIAVTSLGTDAYWQSWETRRAQGLTSWAEQEAIYERISAATAERRASLLGTLLPDLGLEGIVTIEGRFARVRGRRNTYRIHLGSGNIHIEPSGRYLCIVPSGRAPQLYLPFEESDPKYLEIVSKIFLLMRDDRITDPSIVMQIGG